MEIELEKNERMDDLEYKGLHLIQNKDGYCFTSDAVLLANIARVSKGDIVADFGCGNGVISILLAGKTNAKKIYGIELQSEAVALANKNIALNNLEDKVEIINSDILDVEKVIGKESANVVVCNPPYFPLNSGETRLSKSVALSRHESSCTLSDLIRKASEVLKFGGKLFMIHKVERMGEVMQSLENNNLPAKKVTLIYPKASKEVDTFIVEAKKAAKSGLTIDTFIVYNEDGSMTDRAKVLYNKL